MPPSGDLNNHEVQCWRTPPTSLSNGLSKSDDIAGTLVYHCHILDHEDEG